MTNCPTLTVVSSVTQPINISFAKIKSISPSVTWERFDNCTQQLSDITVSKDIGLIGQVTITPATGFTKSTFTLTGVITKDGTTINLDTSTFTIAASQAIDIVLPCKQLSDHTQLQYTNGTYTISSLIISNISDTN